MMDCYAVLGVRQNASQDEIKAAFRERALECHPDRAPEGEEAAAKEEFQRVRKAFELLSDPQKRAKYDASDRETDPTDDSVDDVHVRRRSYQKEWRRRSGEDHTISVRQAILDQVGGLSADYETIRGRTSVTVPLCCVAGALFFLLEPNAIYATDVFLVDLFLCTALGGIYGFVLGYAWGYTDLFFRDRESS
jgi:hypothetical protein